MKIRFLAFLFFLLSWLFIGCSSGGDEAGNSGGGPPGPGNASAYPDQLILPGDDHAPFMPERPGGTVTWWVSPGGDDKNPGTVDEPLREVKWAAVMASPGDVVEILSGEYQSPVIVTGIKGTPEAPVVFRAEGWDVQVNGELTCDCSGLTKDAFFIQDSSYVIIDGITAFGAFRSGVRIENSHHISVQASVFRNNNKYGISVQDSSYVRIAGCISHGSFEGHGILVEGGEHIEIAGNYIYDNPFSAILAAPSSGVGEDRAVLFLNIYRNRLNDNGFSGGAALDLVSVQEAAITNNVIDWNKGDGIRFSDENGSNPINRNNQVIHNTVVFNQGEGGYPLVTLSPASGLVMYNNLFYSGNGPAWYWSFDALEGADSDYNLFACKVSTPLFLADTGQKDNLYSFRQRVFLDQHSTQQAPVFEEEGTGDYRLTEFSPGKDAAINLEVLTTYTGNSRFIGDAPDIGAFE